ncbi:MAG: hypothetical protein HY666_06120 [Chloroflexi bacterium]|nr:hypothetical protein [Chloroflexota bacterium]
MHRTELPSKMRLGFIVFGVLIVIEIIEYVLGVNMKGGAWPLLAVLAVIGAWPIVQYFMHFTQLWRREE